MARTGFFRLDVDLTQRSKGGSAVRRMAYQSAEQMADDRTGEVFDFRHKSPEIVTSRILAPEGAPAWVFDRAELAQRMEKAEKRADAQTGRTFDFAVPREVPPELREAFAAHLLQPYVDLGMVVAFSIHNERASDGGEQPHVSALATMRKLDANGPQGFDRKKETAWNDLFADFRKASGIKGLPKGKHAQAWRAEWTDRANAFCRDHGLDMVVSLASNEDRGLPPPQPVLSKPRLRQLQRLDAQIATVDAEIVDLTAERDRRHPQQPEQPPVPTWRDFVSDARAQAVTATAAARAVQVPARGYAARAPRDAAQIVADRRQQGADLVDLRRHNATKLTELRQQGYGWGWLFHPWRTAARHQQRLENEQYARQALAEAEQQQADTERWLDSEGGRAWTRRTAAAERRAWDNAHGPADRAERQINRHEQTAEKLARVADSVEAAATALSDPRIDDQVKQAARQHLERLAETRPEALPESVRRELQAFGELPAKLDDLQQAQAQAQPRQAVAGPAAPAPPAPAA